jgi:hypothetical protein
MSFPIFIMVMVALTLTLMLGRRQLDALIRHQFNNDRASWEEAGRPIGYFWRPERTEVDTTWIEGTQARGNLVRAWFFKTPDWIEGPMKWKLRLIRLSILISYLGYLLAGLSLMMSQGG